MSRLLRALAVAICFAITAAPARAQQPHSLGVAREARGLVQRITAKGEYGVPNVWVILHRIGNDASAPLDSVRTDPSGHFIFRYRTRGDSTALYFIATSYDGIAYFTPPLRKPLVSGGDADLIVYDTTSAPIPVRVRGRHVIVTAPDTGKGRVVLEVFELSNDSSVTRVAGAHEQPTFESALPDGAFAMAATDGDIPADAVKFDQGHVRVFAPIAPGIKQLTFHYRLPVNKKPIVVPSLAPTSVLEVLVEDMQGDASGANLKKMASVNIENRPFKRFFAQDAPANSIITVLAPTQVGAAFSMRMAIVILAIGAAMLAGLAASVMRKGPLIARAHELGRADPETIARAIAKLDDAFEKISNPSDDQRAAHEHARATLKSRLTDALAQRDELG